MCTSGLQLEWSGRCLQAVLNTAVCTGFVQHAITARYSLQHLFDGSNPSEYHIYARSLCNSGCSCPLAAISWFCVVCCFWLHRVCATCVPTQPGTGSMVCLTASTHANNAHIFHFVCSDCAVAAARSYLITAAQGFVQQVVESGYRLQGHDRQNTSTGYIDVR
jgi:hypothetical protein